MSDRDFQFAGKNFKLNKLDAMKQFHVVRRIGPILSDLLPAMKGIAGARKDIEKLSEAEKLDQIAQFAGPIMTGLSKLSDTDAEFVLNTLLSAVEMQQESGNWARIATTANPPVLMIENLALPVMMRAAGQAFAYNLTGFFSVLPQ